MSVPPNPRQAWAKLSQMVAQQAQRTGGSGGGGGPRAGGAAIASLVLLGAGGVAINNSLFNVDGGHRAIKYARISGVKPEIYPEGSHALPLNVSPYSH